MMRSTERILATHTGSLPRPEVLVKMLYAREHELSLDQSTFEAETRSATAAIVRMQIDSGIDVVNDGEMGKIGYSTYVKDRLTGFAGYGAFPALADLADFPTFAQRFAGEEGLSKLRVPTCTGPIDW